MVLCLNANGILTRKDKPMCDAATTQAIQNAVNDLTGDGVMFIKSTDNVKPLVTV